MVWFRGYRVTAQLSGQSHYDITYKRYLLLVIEYFLFAIGRRPQIANHHSNWRNTPTFSSIFTRYTTNRPGFRIPRGSYCWRICCINALSLKSYPQTSIPAFKDAGADSTITVPREGFNFARKF